MRTKETPVVYPYPDSSQHPWDTVVKLSRLAADNFRPKGPPSENISTGRTSWRIELVRETRHMELVILGGALINDADDMARLVEPGNRGLRLLFRPFRIKGKEDPESRGSISFYFAYFVKDDEDRREHSIIPLKSEVTLDSVAKLLFNEAKKNRALALPIISLFQARANSSVRYLSLASVPNTEVQVIIQNMSTYWDSTTSKRVGGEPADWRPYIRPSIEAAQHALDKEGYQMLGEPLEIRKPRDSSSADGATYATWFGRDLKKTTT